MPILVNGVEIDEAFIDGVEQDEIRIDGTVVYRSETPIDVFDRSDLGYAISDEGQETHPHIVNWNGFDNDNALYCPPGNPNSATNLSPDNPSYSSSNQDVVLDNYLEPGEIAEVYLRAPNWDSNSQFRFALFTDDYHNGENHIRLRFTEGLRLEQGTDNYGGTSSAISQTGLNTNGNWHRLVMDCSDFPSIECHLWDADSGEFLTSVSGDGNGNPSTPGHYVWFNNTTEMYVSDYRLIDDSDFDAGSSL